MGLEWCSSHAPIPHLLRRVLAMIGSENKDGIHMVVVAVGLMGLAVGAVVGTMVSIKRDELHRRVDALS